METLIAFLRGVNITGHNSIKMTHLSDLYNSLGFTDVQTYIQSGNVIFRKPGDAAIPEISKKTEKAILDRFGFKIAVLIRTLPEMRNILLSNPFLNEKNFDPAKMSAIFLYEESTDAQIQKVINVDYPPDRFKINGKEIFIYCPNGFGRTKLYTNFFENKMGVTGTARNWKTITTLLNIAEKI